MALAVALGTRLATSISAAKAVSRVSRLASLGRRTEVVWRGAQVTADIQRGMAKRSNNVGRALKKRIQSNISIPVTKKAQGRDAAGRFLPKQVVESSRSAPGEFPRRDTQLLMKTIFWEKRGDLDVRVGTPLDYGLILETRMNRSFLVRTLHESQGMIRNILINGPPRLPGQE